MFGGVGAADEDEAPFSDGGVLGEVLGEVVTDLGSGWGVAWFVRVPWKGRLVGHWFVFLRS